MQTTKRKLSKAQEQFWFFFKHAGYGYGPNETPRQGRAKCARKLAQAERYAWEQGWEARWEDDWEVGSHKKYYGKGSAYEDREPETCEWCGLYDADGKLLASLGCIDDADANYKRVIRAELALEAMPDAA